MAAGTGFNSESLSRDRTVTITKSGDTIDISSAFTSAAPCTFEAIYQADLSNGWGNVTKLGLNSYRIASTGVDRLRLVFAGFIEGFDQSIQFFNAVPYWRDSGGCRFGQWNAALQIGVNGCNFRFTDTGGRGDDWVFSGSVNCSFAGCNFTYSTGNRFDWSTEKINDATPSGSIVSYQDCKFVTQNGTFVVFHFYQNPASLIQKISVINQSSQIFFEPMAAGLVFTEGSFDGAKLVSGLGSTGLILFNLCRYTLDAGLVEVLPREATQYHDNPILPSGVTALTIVANNLSAGTSTLQRYDYSLSVKDKDGLGLTAKLLIFDNTQANTANITSSPQGIFVTQKIIYYRQSGIDPTNVLKSPHTAVLGAYGQKRIKYLLGYEGKPTFDGQVLIPTSVVLTESQAAAIDWVAINHSTQTITISGNVARSLSDAHDYLQVASLLPIHAIHPDLIEKSGNSYSSPYNWLIDTATLTGIPGTKLVLTSGKTLTTANGGSAALSIQDDSGLLYPITGLPTIAGSSPVLRVERISTGVITNPVVSSGGASVLIQPGVDYKIRAGARGYVSSKFITINSNTSSGLVLALDRVVDGNGAPIYGQGIPGEMDLITFDGATLSLIVAYSAAFPGIRAFSAFDKLAILMATAAGLELTAQPLWDRGSILFPRDMISQATNPTKIKPAIGNTSNPELLFEVIHEGFETPYRLFDIPDTIHYPSTVNRAIVSGGTGGLSNDQDSRLTAIHAATNQPKIEG